jgi:hypothetical protein
MVYSKITFKLMLESRVSVVGPHLKEQLLYLGVDGRVILKWIFIIGVWRHRLDWFGSG